MSNHPTLSLDERKTALESLAAEISVCTKCGLHTGRTRTVPGAGPTNAEIMFIGEGPGFHEDKQGLPFVGQSGKFLEELLALIGLKRTQVFIGNVVKCRPPENRDPLPAEVNTCTTTYLFKQIEIINPRLIVTLGRYSMGLFFPGAKISAIHAKVKWQEDRAYLPLYHPAAVLRNMTKLRPEMEAGIKMIPELVIEARKRAGVTKTKPPAPSEPPAETQDLPPAEDSADNSPESPTQLSLF